MLLRTTMQGLTVWRHLRHDGTCFAADAEYSITALYQDLKSYNLNYALGIMIGLRTGRSGVRILAAAREVTHLLNFQTGFEANPACYFMGTEVLSCG